MSKAFAQTVFQPKQITNSKLFGLVYETEKIYELGVTPNSFFITFNKGTLLSFEKTKMTFFELSTFKDYREQRQNKKIVFRGEGVSDPFVYGKRNNVLMFKIGNGQKRYLSEKAKYEGVAVGFSFRYGATLGLLIPNYIRVLEIDEADAFLTSIRYSEDTRDAFLDYDNIFGGESYFKGFGNLGATLGANFQIAAHFDFGAFEKRAKTVEAGVKFDIFPTKLPILVEREDIRNKYVYINFYVSAGFGSRR